MLRPFIGRRGVVGLWGALGWLLVAGTVLAHAELVDSSPADGASVPAPSEVVATFSEALVGERSSMEVRDAGGATLARGGLDPADPKGRTMRVELPPLEPGTYTVRWTAVADDGHVERGTFSFRVVATPSPSPAPSPTPTEEPSPSAAPTGLSPSPSPDASTTPVASSTSSPSPTSPDATAGDGALAVAVPIVVGLGVAAIAAAWLLRRRGG